MNKLLAHLHLCSNLHTLSIECGILNDNPSPSLLITLLHKLLSLSIYLYKVSNGIQCFNSNDLLLLQSQKRIEFIEGEINKFITSPASV
jgi:hypothetical protein